MKHMHFSGAIFTITLESVETSRKSRAFVPTVTMEFHIAKKVRDEYGFDESIFSITGNVILARFHDVRLFAYKMNSQRDLLKHPEHAIKVGDLNAMGLIDEILHYVIYLYRQEVNPCVMENGLKYIIENVGEEVLETTLFEFASEFPPVSVYKKQTDLHDYLKGSTEGVSNRAIVLEEMLMLWIANMNPAFAPTWNSLMIRFLKKRRNTSKLSNTFICFSIRKSLSGRKNRILLICSAHPQSLFPIRSRISLST
jgi:hypothetical protein